MSVSLSFIKENVPINGHTEAQIQEGVTNNLDLLVYQNDTLLKESSLWVSSTEMCQVPLSNNNFKYRFKIKQNITGENTRFGYAWSTNIMRMSPPPTELDKITEGIYYIKNKSNERYITYDSSAQSDEEQAKIGFTSSISQSKLTDSYKWIVRFLGNGYNVETGFGIESEYLGIGSQQVNNSLSSKVTPNAESIIIEKNTDGSYSIFNSFKNKILTYNSSRCLVWNTYSNGRDINNNEKWYFEKCNYLKGDSNIDGEITSLDASYVQTFLAQITVQNNIERYLSDVDRDGTVSILDVNVITNMVNSIYTY